MTTADQRHYATECGKPAEGGRSPDNPTNHTKNAMNPTHATRGALTPSGTILTAPVAVVPNAIRPDAIGRHARTVDFYAIFRVDADGSARPVLTHDYDTKRPFTSRTDALRILDEVTEYGYNPNVVADGVLFEVRILGRIPAELVVTNAPEDHDDYGTVHVRTLPDGMRLVKVPTPFLTVQGGRYASGYYEAMTWDEYRGV